MAELTHKTAPERAQPQQTAAPVEEEQARVLEEGVPGVIAGAAGATSADNVTARHAAALRDPRLRDAGPLQRARVIQQLQRGYGNGHVARVMQRVQTPA